MRIGAYDVVSIQTGRFALDGGAMFGVVPKSQHGWIFAAKKQSKEGGSKKRRRGKSQKGNLEELQQQASKLKDMDPSKFAEMTIQMMDQDKDGSLSREL